MKFPETIAILLTVEAWISPNNKYPSPLPNVIELVKIEEVAKFLAYEVETEDIDVDQS
jgi:hypothetical protein